MSFTVRPHGNSIKIITINYGVKTISGLVGNRNFTIAYNDDDKVPPIINKMEILEPNSQRDALSSYIEYLMDLCMLLTHSWEDLIFKKGV
jgi:hypothetical protein